MSESSPTPGSSSQSRPPSSTSASTGNHQVNVLAQRDVHGNESLAVQAIIASVPDPAVAAAWNALVPGSAEMILKEYQRHAEHARSLELQDFQMVSDRSKALESERRRGQYFAMVLGAGLVGCLAVAIVYLSNHWTIGAICAVLGSLPLSYALLGRKSNKDGPA